MTEGKELMKGLGDKFQLLVDEIGSAKVNKAVDNIQKLLQSPEQLKVEVLIFFIVLVKNQLGQ